MLLAKSPAQLSGPVHSATVRERFANPRGGYVSGVAFHPLIALLTSGLLQSHGHKTWVAWVIAVVVAGLGFALRAYRRR